MECLKVQEQLIEYVEGALSQNDKQAVEKHLLSCENCQKKLETTTEFLKALSPDVQEKPSERLRINFEQALAEEKKSQQPQVISLKATNNWKLFLKVAAGIALLISSFLLGNYHQEKEYGGQIAELQNESLEMKETAILALMENKSASKRIKGVQYIEEFTEPDTAIVHALVSRMLNDENVNVRLTAVSTLQRFINSEDVKSGYIQALETETDPAIQITIIQLLVKIQEKKALKPMQNLLEQEQTQPFIKEEIKSILTKSI